MLLHSLEGAYSWIIPQNNSIPLCPFPISSLMVSYYCSNIYIKRILTECLFPQFLYLKTTMMTCYIQLQHSTIFKTASKSKLFLEIVLHGNSSCILGKIMLDSLVHLIVKCPLGYMIIDHIALTATRKVAKFSVVCPADMIALCLANCKFYTLD